MWKVNYCDEVSNRDVEVMEMLEWFKLMEQQSVLYDKFHACEFNVMKYARWSQSDAQ
mgnify:CR=1 FL=1|jgi:hypothetical protein